jgi:DNA-directed RNA polymerase subunit H (RpoH/RPB5)
MKTRGSLTMEKLIHTFIPEHTKISDDEKKKLFEKYNISIRDLPKITINDPAIKHLEPKIGDIIKITRKSLTSGTTEFYRGVINE